MHAFVSGWHRKRGRVSTAVRFYHLQRQSEQQVLPMLLRKAYEQGHHIVVKCTSAAQVEAVNEHLWTFDANSFLPHGCEKDGHAEMQPIWITDGDERPNDADVLILMHGATSAQIGDYTLCCEMLNGHDDQGVQHARARWKAYKEQDFEVTYWQQSERGAWEKKA